MSGERLAAGGELLDFVTAPPWAAALDHAPAPFAIATGPTHELVYANRAFRRAVDLSQTVGRIPIDELLPPEAAAKLRPLLGRALAEGLAVHEEYLGPLTRGAAASWSCTLWPLAQPGDGGGGVMLVLRVATHADRRAALQREVAERLLLSAVREADAADVADAARARTTYLLDAGRRLDHALDETATRDTLAGIALPSVGAWCIVDVIEPDAALTRLAMVHPDPRKQEAVRELAKDWRPRLGDPFGAPAVMGSAEPVITMVSMAEVSDALAVAAHSPENLRLLEELVVGPLLTVPLVSHGALLGAVTFVSGRNRAYTPEEVELAEGLAERSAEALSSARLYADALHLREQAEASSRSRMRFLGNISHELRSPLNAIGGYAQLMEEGVHGPVTPAQKRDLERIRLNQEHLQVLVTDVLNFVRAGLTPTIEPVRMQVLATVRQVLSLLQGLADKKAIVCRNEVTDPTLHAEADPDRLQQVLINLLSNAIKFTPRWGEIVVRCEAEEETVKIYVSDNGMGVAPEKVAAIFEPFVQADPHGDLSAGVGLGLAISRDLARAMKGNLTVASTLGRGSTFTLTLPRPAH